MSDYFTRVRRRALGIARGGYSDNCGPPKREPRGKRRVIVHNGVAHTVYDWPGAYLASPTGRIRTGGSGLGVTALCWNRSPRPRSDCRC